MYAYWLFFSWNFSEKEFQTGYIKTQVPLFFHINVTERKKQSASKNHFLAQQSWFLCMFYNGKPDLCNPSSKNNRFLPNPAVIHNGKTWQTHVQYINKKIKAITLKPQWLVIQFSGPKVPKEQHCFSLLFVVARVLGSGFQLPYCVPCAWKCIICVCLVQLYTSVLELQWLLIP